MAVINRIAGYSEEMAAWRQHLHAHPELAFDCVNTAAFVVERLKAFGIEEIHGGFAKTGLVALIHGKEPGPVIGLRADMDALPIPEETGLDYASMVPGVMHACGHDGHTVMLLGAARYLAETRNFAGTVALIFQPAEEDGGGANVMVQEGVLDRFGISEVYALHNAPGVPEGQFYTTPGPIMAAVDTFHIHVKGRGGHGAMPHLNIDPVLIAAQIIIALQQVVSRVTDPKTPSVLSIGKVIANGATNVIPNEVKMEGTFRTLDETWRAAAKIKIQEIAQGIAQSMGGTCDIEIKNGYPFLVNEENTTNITRLAAEEYLGKEQVVELDIWMAAEDFAYYSQEVPACFYRLGTRNESKGITASVHTPNFDIDESALNIGPGLMAYAAIKLLES